MQPGPKNNITDVTGIKIGHAQDKILMSGATVILPDKATVAAVDCRGGGPGTRETDALNPANLVDKIHAIVLSGGSVMGLDAASGVVASLKKQGRGFHVAKNVSVPIVPAAILFDLLNGGEKSFVQENTYYKFGQMAFDNASYECPIGNIGAGTGAKAGELKGGIGTASLIQKSASSSNKGYVVGALAAVNSFGSVTLPDVLDFYAWPFERNGEFGGRGIPKKTFANTKKSKHLNTNEFELDFDFERPFEKIKKTSKNKKSSNQTVTKNNFPTNTTLCVVATDAILTKTQAQRIAIMAQDGFARAIRPVHTPFDGDIVFVLSTGRIPLSKTPTIDIARLGMMSSDCVSRAIARGVFAAESLGTMKSYKDFFQV